MEQYERCAGREVTEHATAYRLGGCAQNGSAGLIVIVLPAPVGGGGALYWFKLPKPKRHRGADDLDITTTARTEEEDYS